MTVKERPPGIYKSPVANLYTRLEQALSQSSAYTYCAVSLIALLLCLPLTYRGGFGEPDVAGMVTGAYQTALNGTPTGLYFHKGQPLYNTLLIKLVLWFSLSYDSLAWITNLFGPLSIAATMGSLAWLCRRVAGWLPTLLGVATCFFSPIVWELGTYAHPQTISIALMLAAFIFALLATEPAAKFCTVAHAATAAVFAITAMLLRMDALLLQPLLFGISFMLMFPLKRLLLLNLAFPMGYVGGALLLRQPMLSPSDLGTGGPGGDLLKALQEFSTGNLVDGTKVFFIAAGTGTALLLLAGFALAAYRRDWRALLAAAAAFLPVFYYCAYNPFITRRFIHSLIPAAFVIAVLYRTIFANQVNIIEQKDGASKKKKARGNSVYASILLDKSPFRSTRRAVWVYASILLVGNFVFWPLLAFIGKASDDPLPARFPYTFLSTTLLQRHFKIQEHITWAREAYVPFVQKVPPSTELIGGWVENGNILAAFCRLSVPVQIQSVSPEKSDYPPATLITGGGKTIRLFSPPWNLPPPQRAPIVFLLNRYPRDVAYGRKNVYQFVPPEGVQYLSW